MDNPFSKPGFGWANNHKDNVIIINGGKVGMLDNFANAATFINNQLGVNIDHANFVESIENAMKSVLGDDVYGQVINEIFSKGTSNNRELKYDLMKIQPNVAFKLHAHPNVEVIYVIKGALYEFRLQVLHVKMFRINE